MADALDLGSSVERRAGSSPVPATSTHYMESGAMNDLNEATFAQEVSSQGVVVVDFWGPRCGPCRALAPVLEKVAETTPDAKFAKVNVDDAPTLFQEHKVSSIPCLIFFKDGKETARLVGLQSETKIKDTITRVKADERVQQSG